MSQNNFITTKTQELKIQNPYTNFCMETLKLSPKTPLMSSKFFASFSQKLLATQLTITRNYSENIITCSANTLRKVKSKISEAETAKQLKEKWLHSLSSPFVNQTELYSSDCNGVSNLKSNLSSNWVIGIDPDISGAIALLKFDDENDSSVCSAEVFDSPHLKVSIGNKIRKRLDAKSIVQLLRSFDAPIGTTAYIEQSTPFPQDGKQGWWSGGFNYGLWIGTLVASGFSVVPVASVAWKNEYELCGSRTAKDDSRRLALSFFPSLSSSLQRKKDHGRAEALLIAAYGKGLKLKSDFLPSL